MTVGELLAQISSKELSEWIAFYGIEPFGEERADLRSAQIVCMMANLWGRKKNQREYEISDFLFKFGPPREQATDEIKAFFRGISPGQ